MKKIYYPHHRCICCIIFPLTSAAAYIFGVTAAMETVPGVAASHYGVAQTRFTDKAAACDDFSLLHLARAQDCWSVVSNKADDQKMTGIYEQHSVTQRQQHDRIVRTDRFALMECLQSLSAKQKSNDADFGYRTKAANDRHYRRFGKECWPHAQFRAMQLWTSEFHLQRMEGIEQKWSASGVTPKPYQRMDFV